MNYIKIKFNKWDEIKPTFSEHETTKLLLIINGYNKYQLCTVVKRNDTECDLIEAFYGCKYWAELPHPMESLLDIISDD